ncbi:MAG: MFS transporter [Gammaproteobacteria bacterium]|nr:MFS transporter [Gammaproteobacteria bacterium]
MAESSAIPDDARLLIDAGRISSLQWLVFALCFLMNALDGMDVLVISYAAPLLAEEWAIEPAALGVVFSAGLLGMTSGAMFIAPYADTIGRRRMIMISIVLTGSAVLATAFAQTLGSLMVLRFLSGLGIGAMLASVATMAAEFAPDRHRNLILGAVLAGYPVGATLFGVISADIIPNFGWRAIFVTAGVATLITLPLTWWLLPESPSFLMRMRPAGALDTVNRLLERMGHARIESLPAAHTQAEERRSVRALFTAELTIPTTLLWGAFFMNFAALYFLTSWIPKLATSAGLALELAIYAGAVFNLGAVFGIATFGVLSQQLGLRRTIAAFLLLTALIMAGFGLAQGSALILPLFGLIGFFIQGGFVGLYAIAARLYPTAIRTTGVGWSIGAGRTGAIVGPLLGGLLVAAGLSIGSNFRWFALTLVLAGLFTILIRSPRVS